MATEPASWGSPTFISEFNPATNIASGAISGFTYNGLIGSTSWTWKVDKGVLNGIETAAPVGAFYDANGTSASTDTYLIAYGSVGTPAGIALVVRDNSIYGSNKRFYARLQWDGVYRINNGQSTQTANGTVVLDPTSAYELHHKVFGTAPDIGVIWSIVKSSDGSVAATGSFTDTNASSPNSGSIGYGTSLDGFSRFTKLVAYTPSQSVALTAGYSTAHSSDDSTVVIDATSAYGGTTPITYEWKYDSNPAFDPMSTGTTVVGQTTRVMTATGITGTQYFKCVATDNLGAKVAYNGVVSTAFVAPIEPGITTRTSFSTSQVVITRSGTITGGVAPYTKSWHRHTVSSFDPIASPTTYLMVGETGDTLTDNAAKGMLPNTVYFYKCVITDDVGTKAVCEGNINVTENLVTMAGLDPPTPSTTLNPSAASVPAVFGTNGSSTYARTQLKADGHTESVPVNASHLLTTSKGSTVTVYNRAQSGLSITDYYGAGSQAAPAVTAYNAAGVTTLVSVIGSNSARSVSVVDFTNQINAYDAYWQSNNMTRLLYGAIGVRIDTGSTTIDKIIAFNSAFEAKAVTDPTHISYFLKQQLVYQVNRVGGASNTLDADRIHQTPTGSDAAAQMLAQEMATFYAQVANPIFSPVAGTYTSVQSVSISTPTSGATIRYTLDGTNPTSTTGTIYSGAISVGVTETIKAIAYKSGVLDSAVVSALYMINLPVAPTETPTITLRFIEDGVEMTTDTPPTSATVEIYRKLPGETTYTLVDTDGTYNDMVSEPGDTTTYKARFTRGAGLEGPIATSQLSGAGGDPITVKTETWTPSDTVAVPDGLCNGIRVNQAGIVEVIFQGGSVGVGIPVTPESPLYGNITHVKRAGTAHSLVTLVYIE